MFLISLHSALFELLYVILILGNSNWHFYLCYQKDDTAFLRFLKRKERMREFLVKISWSWFLRMWHFPQEIPIQLLSLILFPWSIVGQVQSILRNMSFSGQSKGLLPCSGYLGRASELNSLSRSPAAQKSMVRKYSTLTFLSQLKSSSQGSWEEVRRWREQKWAQQISTEELLPASKMMLLHGCYSTVLGMYKPHGSYPL